ncbi:Protein kinase-like domain [Pseudocohnilembus persalinus]|uniref:Protein kinase-like domain n=1 Tax=Pseudocohnilembus persalinus TaxID=266149 RepID=A0A0V0QBW2_PSEPJ|nr:Protein kinase-like domain [Pseudocohnilembus persalinus]|eukprot:KRW99540.1 Protein kinase-like domain [Pseudocohnilembus persalinus]
MSKIVFGYQIDIALGQNNLSTTFRAFKNNQTYLLKCFSKKELSHPLILNHFHHEAIEQEKLKNIPNVLHLVEKFQTQHNYYLVYEDCNDWMISQFVQKHGFLPENYALDLIKQIINAYQQLKKQNIQNRDISIHNILKHNNQIYIDDFGFDRLIQFQLLQQNQRQYQLYLAPELFLKNNQIDQLKVEAWSIGIILYYLLFKRYPYDTKNTLQMFKDIQNKAIFIPLNINNISIQCQNLLIKLLFANPSQRLSFNEILNHQVFQIQSENQNKMIQKVQQFSQDPENHWKKSMYMKFKPQIRAQQNKFSLSPTGQQNQTVKKEQEKFLKIPNQVDNVKQIMRSHRDEIIKQNPNYPVFSNQNSNQNQSPSVFTNSSYSSNLYSQPQEPSVTNNVYQSQYQPNQIGAHKMNEEKQDNSPNIIKFSSYVPKNQNKGKFDLSDNNSNQNKISNQNLIPEIKNQSKISDYDSFIVIKSSDSDENQNQNPNIINFNDSQIPDIITNSTTNNQKSNFITQTSLIREPAQQQKPENTVDSNQLKQEIDHLKNVTKKLDILGETLVEIDEPSKMSGSCNALSWQK